MNMLGVPKYTVNTHVLARLRSRYGGSLPEPRFIREGDWIAMPGVPLITAGDTEDDGTNAPGDVAHATEEATEPTFEGVHVGG
jgi:hypothetical protein